MVFKNRARSNVERSKRNSLTLILITVMKNKILILAFISSIAIDQIHACAFFVEDSLKKNTPSPPYQKTATRIHDLIHTKLEVDFDWQKSEMKGKAEITGKPYFKPTHHLELDARGMLVESLEVYDLGKKPVTLSTNNPEIPGSKKLNSTYTYENDKLKINLGREFAADEKYLIKIKYVAKPNEIKKGGSAAISDDRGLFFINADGEEKNKMPQIWTQGETQANSVWFPTIDNPNEKMTTEILMTVDNKYTTLSNGKIISSKRNANGSRTDHWKMAQPHSPYLVMMAIGEFVKIVDAPWNGKEISYYVEKEYAPYAKAIFGNTKEMIDFYSKILDTPYPWDKYAQIVVRDYVSGAMENTTATLHGDFMVYQNDRELVDGKKGEAVIAHELFHQWFGDLVTAESWSNLPLNESFATYGEYLWEEYKNGRDAADAHSFKSRSEYFQNAEKGQVEMIRYHYHDAGEMFDVFSYNKGGQILHMLRKYTGDKAFFSALKLYLERNRFKSAEIHDLRLAFEEITGEDLNWFFYQWFLKKGHPELNVEKSYDVESKILKLKVTQTQNLDEAPLYTLPLDIDVYFGGKKERHSIVIDKKEQEFIFSVAAEPELVNFDAERQLLAKKNYAKTKQEYIFQYKNAPLFGDRFESLQYLSKDLADPEVFNLFLDAANKDSWYENRMTAIKYLRSVAKERETELKPTLKKIAETDPNTNVRAYALYLLFKNYNDQELNAIYEKTLNEKSYMLVSTALEALNKHQTELALQKAVLFENEKNDEIYISLANIYAAIGSDENSSYFIKSSDYFKGYTFATYVKYYGKFLNRCKKASSFETASKILIDNYKFANEYTQELIQKTYKNSILETIQKQIDAQADNTTAKELTIVKSKLENDYKTISEL